MRPVEETLQRWIRAGVLDEGTAERIRQYEAARERSAGLRWQVLLALVLEAILLAARVIIEVITSAIGGSAALDGRASKQGVSINARCGVKQSCSPPARGAASAGG